MDGLPVSAAINAQERPLKAADSAIRFHFIDALRGIAAVMVLVFHLWHNAGLAGALAPHLPPWFSELIFSTHTGVDIFFVISGFVIAHSIRDLRVSARTAANFALRRQIRLDPPYWTCIFCTMIFVTIAKHRTPDLIRVPSFGDVLLNLFYLHGICGAQAVMGVSWTLCLEVQFYIVLIVLAWVAQRWERRRAVQFMLVVALTFVSLALTRYGTGGLTWFIHLWYMFALGVISYSAHTNRSIWVGAVALASFILAASIWRPDRWSHVAPATALALLVVGRAGHLSDWLSGPVFQYFGRISYSLYLVHFSLLGIVTRRGLGAAHKWPAAAIALGLAAAAVAIGAAHLLHKYIERPSTRLASRLKPKRAQMAGATGELPHPARRLAEVAQ